MMVQFIPFTMVLVFLTVTLLLGLYISFNREAPTLRTYAVGDKKLPTATLITTVLATLLGGAGLLRTLEQVPSQGFGWMVFTFAGFLSFLFISPLMMRVEPFLHHLTLPESIGSAYGKISRVVTALVCIACDMVMLSMHIHALSISMRVCIGLDHGKIVTVIATFILVLYATFGGIRTVTLTDVLLFCIFIAVFPILMCITFLKVNQSLWDVCCFLQKEIASQCKHMSYGNFLSIITLSLANAAFVVQPTVMHKVYMADSPKQVKDTFFYTGILGMLIRGAVMLIALFIFVRAPGISSESGLSYMVSGLPAAFQGIIAIALLSMAMSTADSKVNTTAVMIGYDLITSISGKEVSLWFVKFVSFIVGMGAMLLSFQYDNLWSPLLWALNVYIPLIPPLFILALLGFRSSTATALTGITVGALSIWCWNQWITPITGINGAFFCMLANGLAMLSVHYLFPQPEGSGWAKSDYTFKQMVMELSRIKVGREKRWM